MKKIMELEFSKSMEDAEYNNNDSVIVLVETSEETFLIYEYDNKKKYKDNEVSFTTTYNSLEEVFINYFTKLKILSLSKIISVDTKVLHMLKESASRYKSILLYLLENIEQEYMSTFYDFILYEEDDGNIIDILEVEDEREVLIVKKNVALHNNYVHIINIKMISIDTLKEKGGYAFIDKEGIYDIYKKVECLFYTFDALSSNGFHGKMIKYYDEWIDDDKSFLEENQYDEELKERIKLNEDTKRYFIEDYIKDLSNNSKKFNS